jgi:hypothetical protein
MTLQADPRYVTVKFPYSVVGVQKGFRVEGEVFAWGETSAAIEVARLEDTQLAFRVHYPADNPLRYVYPSAPAPEDGHRAASRIEIIRYEGKFWWPVKSGIAKTRYDVLSPSDALGQLEFMNCDILNITPPAANFGRSPLQMRSISEDRTGQGEASAQRIVAENLLICGNRIYARGGEPLYVKLSHGRSRTWEVAVVDPGFCRRLNQAKIGERSRFDQYYEWWIQDAFCNGLFWRANMRDIVEGLAHPMQTDIPTIKAVSTEPSVDNTNRIVTDALFRKAITLLNHFYPKGDSMLSKACAIQMSDQKTTAARRAALQEFFRTPSELHDWKPMTTLREQFRRFDSATSPGLLAPEDELALDALVKPPGPMAAAAPRGPARRPSSSQP